MKKQVKQVTITFKLKLDWRLGKESSSAASRLISFFLFK